MSAKRLFFLLLITTGCANAAQNLQEENVRIPVKTTLSADVHTRNFHTDTLKFLRTISEGENFLFSATGTKEHIFFYNNIREKKLTRGDVIEVKWKTTDAIAQDVISVKKLKDGPVALFRKKHPQIIRALTEVPVNDWDPYTDELYLAVEYYLSQTKEPLLQHVMKTSFNDILFTAEEKERDGRVYNIIGIAQNSEHKLNTMQWLFLDAENLKLYEYDLPNDQLIEVH